MTQRDTGRCALGTLLTDVAKDLPGGVLSCRRGAALIPGPEPPKPVRCSSRPTCPCRRRH